MKNIVVLGLFFISFISISLSGTQKDVKFQNQETIIIYGSDTCHYCLDTKTYLKESGIGFIYFDVDVNLEKQREMIEKLKKANISLSNLSLPVIDKKGEIFTNGDNFDKFLQKIIE